MRAWLAAATLACAAVAVIRGQGVPAETLLQRAAAYLDDYQRQLATVTAEESYLFRGTRERKTISSDMLLVATDGSWLEFRDIFEVNNRPVRDHQARLEALLGNPAELLVKAQQIADESARQNAGAQRNINVPTMALTYLTKANQARSTFRILGSGDHGTTVLAFKETARPPLIHTNVGVTQTSGRFWIDPATGAVTKSELVLKLPEGNGVKALAAVSGSITVTYELDETLKFLVPKLMVEDYSQPMTLTGRASYSHYKSFGVVVTANRGRGGRS
jgi:hypothetical protein